MSPDISYDPNKRFKVPTYLEAGQERVVRLFHDLEEAVLWDKWMFIVAWGEQRTGKSTLCLWCAYFLWRMLCPDMSEEDLWQHVYSSIIYNLGQLIYKIKNPNEYRIWDLKHLHYRIPILVWDDFAVHSNKAVTRSDPAWDQFKGGFDAMGTKLGVIIMNMTTPEQPTTQIEHKYTHEVIIQERGKYKYDKVIWLQDYRGWQAKHGKDWQQEHTFGEIPLCRFLPYDEMRTSLADEVLTNIQDSMSRKIPWLIRRLTKEEIELLRDLKQIGPMPDGPRRQKFASVIIKAKARQLVVPTKRHKNSWWLDIADLGLDVLDELDKRAAGSEGKDGVE